MFLNCVLGAREIITDWGTALTTMFAVRAVCVLCRGRRSSMWPVAHCTAWHAPISVSISVVIFYLMTHLQHRIFHIHYE